MVNAPKAENGVRAFFNTDYKITDFAPFSNGLYAAIRREAAVDGQHYARDKACRFIVDKE